MTISSKFTELTISKGRHPELSYKVIEYMTNYKVVLKMNYKAGSYTKLYESNSLTIYLDAYP